MVAASEVKFMHLIPLSHLDTAAATPEVPINVWPQREAAGCQDSLLGALCHPQRDAATGVELFWRLTPTGTIWVTLASRVCL